MLFTDSVRYEIRMPLNGSCVGVYDCDVCIKDDGNHKNEWNIDMG